jgi:hypothetical protein
VPREIPPPPEGLTLDPHDPTFAMGPVLPNNDPESRVVAFRECAEFVGGKWEGFVSVVCLRRREQTAPA